MYDLTSTYFEIDSPLSDTDKYQFGYSRDKRSDCAQVVIALIVTPQRFPLERPGLPLIGMTNAASNATWTSRLFSSILVPIGALSSWIVVVSCHRRRGDLASVRRGSRRCLDR